MWGDMSETKKFFILLITQLIGAIVILGVASILLTADIIQITFKEMVFLFAIAIIAICVLLTSNPVMKYFNISEIGLKVNWSIWIIFVLDLAGLSYLIYQTGGIPGSPFTPFLLYLPTNGIVLDQNLRTVASYYLCIIFPAVVMTLFIHQNPIAEEKFFHYKIAVLIIFLFAIVTAVAGYSVRYSRKFK